MSAASWPRRHRLTVRARLSLSHVVLLVAASAVVLTALGVVVTLLPTYGFAATTQTATGSPPQAPAGATPADVVEVVDVGLLSPALLSIGSREELVRVVLWASAAALVLIVGAGGWVSWVSAGRLTRPLQQVNEAATRAAHGDLRHRIDIPGPRDELTDLADTMNEMLGRLDDQLTAHRRFAANASHELRTPLASTRAMLDVALSGTTEPDPDLLVHLRATNERSIATVESLMDLAEIEHADPPRDPVDLAGLVLDVVGDCQAEAAAREVHLVPRLGEAPTRGDAVLLRQLAANLVQNAIRHNVPGGSVVITTGTWVNARTGSESFVQVVNGGRTVPPDDLARLADPFFRVAGRTSTPASRGRGLGLAIVEAIVRRHGGRLTLTAPGEGGLVVTVALAND
ncbi:MAG: hypothetical protein BGO96_13600 [Micrococcales bacterium 73-15]|nr:MAG: hypothetical protein BGO96_13600 [Micrococcales bacterium 73-15]